MKRVLATALSALLLVSLLPACSSKPSSDSSSAQSCRIDITHMFPKEQESSDTTNKVFHTLLDRFQSENKNISLNITEMEQSNYATKIQAQAAANDLPDVFLVKGSWMKNFNNNKAMAPLDKYINQQGIREKYRTSALDPATMDGKTYGLPLTCGLTSFIFYNTDIMKSIGYSSFPTTWDGIFQAAAKLKAKGIPMFSLGNKDKWPVESSALSTLADRYLGTEWTQNIIANNGKAKFTDDGFVKALTFLQKMSKSGLFNADFNTVANTQGDTYYCQGKSAATISGYWTVSFILQNATPQIADSTKMTILPPVDEEIGSTNTTSGGSGWFVCVNSKLQGTKLDAAVKLASYLTGTKASTLLTQNGIVGPINVKTDTSKLKPLQQEYIKQGNTLRTTPIFDARLSSSVVDVMNSGLQELLNGTIAPKDLAAKIQAEQDKLK